MGDELYRSDGEVGEVLRRFESCELPPAEFDHGRHLTVALALVAALGDERRAAARMREGLARFIAANGVSPRKYHETLTVFWVRRVGAFAARAGAGRPLAEVANELIAECGDPRLVFEYYSRALVDSEDARARWVEPDLKPLDF
ncbi:MAG TPA: hypothetical protein VN228_09865 [Pyrinomonadaceae bacterium]|nr:hypothetical protein [Pyrinomonadaceae bacterium]